MDFQQLEPLIILWAKEKGILDKATPMQQFSKTDEEVNELGASLFAQHNNLSKFKNSKGVEVDTFLEIKDAIGDILVTLIIQCKMQGLTMTECLESAYNVISKRTGKMINGIFVKEDKNN